MSQILNTDRGTYDLSKREDVYRYFCQNFGLKGDDLSLLERFLLRNEERDKLAEQVKLLKEALEFYADHENQRAKVGYVSLPTGQVHHVTSNYEEDAGDKAREALKNVEGK